jgi:3-methylcrotonyl-CoA carboxylase alpha subunit
MPYFTKVLIANRGEIAVRVMRACRELGIATVAVYSEVDRFAMHARVADEAVLIGPAPARESYLNIPAIIAAAQATGAAAIHPGYGFLSENADFAAACVASGLTFIGPPPDAIRLMGSKTAAKAAVMQSDVPTVPGYQGDDQSPAAMARAAKRIGYPVMIKAAAGGGGKGMRVVQHAEDFADALAAAQREALAAFGDATVFLEKALVRPRHIEFQIMADQQGNCIHLGERECSIQRRHQKVIEESPSVALTPELRATMGAAATRAALAAGYVNAGTVEFLLDQQGNYYFLEMNTRLQVEHPVTEQVTGRDLVRLQLAVAAGEPLPLRQEEIAPRGHAIEVRLYAEDPVTYLPATGTLLAYDPPAGPGIRLDGGVARGDAVTMYYDPMLAKLIVTADDRALAIARLQSALANFGILGVTTNLPLLCRIVADERFQRGETYTDFLESDAFAEGDNTNSPSPLQMERDRAAGSDPQGAERSMHVGRGPGGEATLLLAAAIFERGESQSVMPVKRSPWSVGALRSGTFTGHYVVGDATRTVAMHDDPTQPGMFTAQVDGDPFVLSDETPGIALLAQSLAATGAIIIRQGARQTRLWVARRPDDGALLITDGHVTLTVAKPQPPDVDRLARGSAGGAGQKALTAPMAGTVIQVRVAAGDAVAERQTLLILSAMKMEHAITAPYAARVRRVLYKEGDVVTGGAILVELEADKE